MINSDEAISQEKVVTDWGEYLVDLHPYNSAFKTLPNDYEEDKLTYTFDIPDSLSTPLLQGQTVGKAKLSYDGEEIDDVKVIVSEDEGLGMLSDMGHYYSYIYSQLMVNEPPETDEDDLSIGSDSGEDTENEATIGLDKPDSTE